MAGYQELAPRLEAQGISVVAASVDDLEKAREVQEGLGFPIAHGVTRAQADALGAWWDPKRDFIQPTEFLIRRDGRIVNATYSSGPLGRLRAEDALSLVEILKARSREKGKRG